MELCHTIPQIPVSRVACNIKTCNSYSNVMVESDENLANTTVKPKALK